MSKFKEGAARIRHKTPVDVSGGVPVGVTANTKHASAPVINFMDGTSWDADPLATLRMVAASSIFGEPQYYRDGDEAAARFERAIDAALDFDYVATLDFAVALRKTFYMRLNPAVIIVRAACHPARPIYTANHPNLFRRIVNDVVLRPDDITTMLEYFMARRPHRKPSDNKKSRLPNVLARALTEKLGRFSAYHIRKYADRGMGLVDVVRILNTRQLRTVNPAIETLMAGGKIAEMPGAGDTWRNRKSAGAGWDDMISAVRRGELVMTHSDYVAQIRNIVNEASPSNAEFAAKSMTYGADKGMLWPHQYWRAYREVENANAASAPARWAALTALERCMQVSIAGQARFRGRVGVLADNSGSARGGEISEMGETLIYEIGNLSAVLAAMLGDSGTVFAFGDQLAGMNVINDGSLVAQVKQLNELGNTVGQNTENGAWLFWEAAIAKRAHYDTVLIYSDMQAGRGGLYGTNESRYEQYIYPLSGNRIDIWKLVQEYRAKVNRHVNVFCVQIAGYDNSQVPENMYRGANLTGWTGKEAAFAAEIAQQWDAAEGRG